MAAGLAPQQAKRGREAPQQQQQYKSVALQRPAACPPLFKAAPGGVMRPPLPPPPPPSAQKTAQAMALGAKFFAQERGLLALLSASNLVSNKGPAAPAAPAMPPPPPPIFLGPRAPLVPPPVPMSPSLAWALTQIRQQQQQQK